MKGVSARELAQWLRAALKAVVVNPGSIPSTEWNSQLSVTPVPRNATPLVTFMGTKQIYGALTYLQAKHPCEIILNKKFF